MEHDLIQISNSIQKAAAITNKYNNILLSISGGSDSDIMLDMILKVADKSKIKVVYFDIGIDYQATKDHLIELEKKYDIEIDKVKANIPIPLSCKLYGVPFLSKSISHMIYMLQKKGFDFANDGTKSFEDLMAKYPNTKTALSWWCNKYPKGSQFNISINKFLKEFMIENPPQFNISRECCNVSKKRTTHKYENKNNFDLKCLGLRKAEGGIRAYAFKSCYEYDNKKKMQDFRPLWNLTNEDKEAYCKIYSVEHSKCYTQYGMKRTGCAGCPFNSKFEDEIEIIKKYEPKLYLAVNNIFGASYDYTRRYRQYKQKKLLESVKQDKDQQLSMFDIPPTS